MENNSKNNTGYQIHCCTICLTFGSVSGKQIIQYFVHLRTIWVTNLVDFFVIDVGSEVIFQKKDLIMILCAPVMIFITTNISII